MSGPENPNAFPFSAEYGHPAACGGMTLRDWFAGQALIAYGSYPERPSVRASDAYALADAMLAERAREVQS